MILPMFVCTECTKEDRENTIITQEANIDSYISSLNGNRVVRNNGSNRVVLDEAQDSTIFAESGDTLHLRYSGYTFSSGPGILFVTNDTTTANEKEFPLQESPLIVRLGDNTLVQGLEYGLYGVREGEHSYIIFSAKYGFNNSIVGIVPKLTPLLYEIWVDKIIKVVN